MHNSAIKRLCLRLSSVCTSSTVCFTRLPLIRRWLFETSLSDRVNLVKMQHNVHLHSHSACPVCVKSGDRFDSTSRLTLELLVEPLMSASLAMRRKNLSVFLVLRFYAVCSSRRQTFSMVRWCPVIITFVMPSVVFTFASLRSSFRMEAVCLR